MPEIKECQIIQPLACYYDLYVPEACAQPSPLVIALHGYGGDKSSMMKLMRRINEKDFVIAALQGPHHHLVMPTKEKPQATNGFGWLNNFKSAESVALHHALVRQVIAEQTATGLVDAQRVFLLGFSQAVGANFRFAFTHPELIRGVVAIAGGIPGDWETAGKYAEGQLDVLYLAGERDEFYTAERFRQNAKALARRAKSVEFKLFDAPHEVPREAYGVINAWLQEQMQD